MSEKCIYKKDTVKLTTQFIPYTGSENEGCAVYSILFDDHDVVLTIEPNSYGVTVSHPDMRESKTITAEDYVSLQFKLTDLVGHEGDSGLLEFILALVFMSDTHVV